MTANQAAQLADEQLADEQQLMTLLDQHTWATDAAERKKLEGQIYQVVDRHFRQAIRGWLAAKYGRGLKDDRHGQGASYTALFHDFFVKVLESLRSGR